MYFFFFFFFFQAEDGIRDGTVTGVQTCALPILNNTTAFQQYRLRITANNGATTRLQLAEIQLFGPPGCAAETNAQFCSRLGKNCGSVTGTDNCGATRTVTSCGTCKAPATCGGGGTANACGTAGSNCSAAPF